MIKKSLAYTIFGVLILSSLACSISQCTQQLQYSVATEPDPQDILNTEIVREETQTETHVGHILYSDSDGLYFYNVATSQSSQIVSGNISDAEISPDGSYLAYLEKSPDPEKWMVKTLQVMNLETSEFLPTSSVPDDINAFTWYKDSASITYSRKNYDYCMDFVDRQISGLYQFNIASDETTRLHIGTDQYIFWVEEWSPDGRYLLFSHAPDCSEGQMLTYYDVQTNEVNGIPFAEASWSPESDSLVGNDIWYWEPEEFPLAKYTISSGDQINLYSQKDEYVNNPKWSPNGEWITFSRSHINPDNSDILLLNVNTNEIEVLPTQNAHTELWNTYGNMIILSVFQDDFSKDIYCYDIDTGTIDKLLSGIDNVYQWVDE